MIPKSVLILFYSVFLFFIFGLCILFFGKVDEVIKVYGVIRTKENVSTVKNVISGKIIQINYKPGKHVQKGELLFSLDPAVYEAQKKDYEKNIQDLEEKIRGNNLLIQSYNQNKNIVPKSDELYYTKFEVFLFQKKELMVKKKIARIYYDEEINNHIALQNKKNIELRKNDYELAVNALDLFCSNFIQLLYIEKNNLELNYSKMCADYESLISSYDYLNIYSPMDGYIQEISSINVNDFIQADTNIVNIIPDDLKNFRVELTVHPKDIGKIKEGMKVKYRISAFPFFEYKGAQGVITSVDPDIRTNLNNGALYYILYSDIDKINFSNSKGESYPIKAGLETDARIILEKNRIIYYLLKKIDFIN
jgi:multidrug efflux pump subunit AcrA (membrane-fusion protein)